MAVSFWKLCKSGNFQHDAARRRAFESNDKVRTPLDMLHANEYLSSNLLIEGNSLSVSIISNFNWTVEVVPLEWHVFFSMSFLAVRPKWTPR